jgi:transcriptional regulator with XRE-family HTH domain
MADGISLRSKVAGAALRRYREAIGYQLEDAARVLDCDRSKISRIETGIRGIRPLELRILLEEYGVDARDLDDLIAITGRRTGRGWWDEYADVLPPTCGTTWPWKPSRHAAGLRAAADPRPAADPGIRPGPGQRGSGPDTREPPPGG